MHRRSRFSDAQVSAPSCLNAVRRVADASRWGEGRGRARGLDRLRSPFRTRSKSCSRALAQPVLGARARPSHSAGRGARLQNSIEFGRASATVEPAVHAGLGEASGDAPDRIEQLARRSPAHQKP